MRLDERKGLGMRLNERKGLGMRLDERKGLEMRLNKRKGLGMRLKERKGLGMRLKERKGLGMRLKERKGLGMRLWSQRRYNPGTDLHFDWGALAHLAHLLLQKITQTRIKAVCTRQFVSKLQTDLKTEDKVCLLCTIVSL